MINYIVNTNIKYIIDTQTNNTINIGYWEEDDGHLYTNRKHLEFLSTLSIYSIDVNGIISMLEALDINQELLENASSIENTLGISITANDISNINLINPGVGDILTLDSEGNIVNNPKRDNQKIKAGQVWGTNNKDWELIEGFEFTTKSLKINDYRIFISLLAEATSNDTQFAIGVFLNNEEQTDLTRTITFDKKEDTKSLSYITYLEDVPIDSTISLKIKRVSSKNGVMQIEHRTFIIEED